MVCAWCSAGPRWPWAIRIDMWWWRPLYPWEGRGERLNRRAVGNSRVANSLVCRDLPTAEIKRRCESLS